MSSRLPQQNVITTHRQITTNKRENTDPHRVDSVYAAEIVYNLIRMKNRGKSFICTLGWSIALRISISFRIVSFSSGVTDWITLTATSFELLKFLKIE